jgi:hypothetical protein
MGARINKVIKAIITIVFVIIAFNIVKITTDYVGGAKKTLALTRIKELILLHNKYPPAMPRDIYYVYKIKVIYI